MSIEAYQPSRMLDPRTDSWTAVVEQVAVFATRIQDTELVPAQLRKKPAAIAAVILYGREVGLPPMTALRTSFVVNGRVGLAAETLRALVLAAGHEITYEESTTARCVVTGRRRGSETTHTVSWDMAIARQAGLAGQPTWQKYPRQMLKARATAELCRDLFPDVIGGFEAAEEMDSYAPPNGQPVAEPPPPRRTVKRAGGPAALQPPAPPDAGAPPTADAEPTPAPSGVPLPGEDGYEELGAENMPKNIPAEVTPEEEPERRDTAGWPRTEAQSKKLFAMLGNLGIRDRELGLAFMSLGIGRPLETSRDLTRAEARGLIDFLTLAETSDELSDQIAEIVSDPNPIAALNRFADMFGAAPIPDDQP